MQNLLEGTKTEIWQEVQCELQKRNHPKGNTDKDNRKEHRLDKAEKTAKELVQTFLHSDDASWGMSDLRKEAKNKGLKWTDIQRELRRVKYENDAKLGEALSRNERILEVKYPHWEIGYERGISDAWFERFLRLENAVVDMMNNGVPLDKIAYYTDLPEEELKKIIESLNNRDGRE